MSNYKKDTSLNQIFIATSNWLNTVKQLFKEPYRWIIHPSVWRLRWLSLFLFFGNIIFYFIWTYVIPQPFESFLLRLFVASLALIFLFNTNNFLRNSTRWKYAYSVIIFIQLPLFFMYMCYMNNFNLVWQCSLMVMVLIYHQATDWRLASISILFLSILTFCFHLYYPTSASSYEIKVFVIIFMFSWLSAIVAGGSSANLLKQYLLNTAFNLGVMAHELRTPISSINILNHVLKKLSSDKNDPQLADLANKLSVLLKTINQHIDDQIANSKNNFRDIKHEICSSEAIVENVLSSYPFKSASEKLAVTYTSHTNFQFIGNTTLFIQVINNLLKNSFKALRTKELNESEMNINIFITTQTTNKATWGIIEFKDNGVGIKRSELQRVLEPFVSSAGPLGHGLGLPFCKNVLESFNGRLRIESEHGVGTIVFLEIPILKI